VFRDLGEAFSEKKGEGREVEQSKGFF